MDASRLDGKVTDVQFVRGRLIKVLHGKVTLRTKGDNKPLDPKGDHDSDIRINQKQGVLKCLKIYSLHIPKTWRVRHVISLTYCFVLDI